jgi:hypothetical protein
MGHATESLELAHCKGRVEISEQHLYILKHFTPNGITRKRKRRVLRIAIEETLMQIFG